MRFRNKFIINAFEDCQHLIANVHKVGKNFIKSSMNIMRFDVTKIKHAKTDPNKNIAIDPNTALVAAARVLVSEHMRMKKVLQCCTMDYEMLASFFP